VALSNALLLPLPQVSNDHQQWDARSKQFEVFIKQLTMPFENILNAETIRQGSLTSEVMKNVADVTTRVVRIVSSILSDVRTDVHSRPSASLNALYRAFLPTFTVAATLLQPFLRNGDVLNTLMELFTNAFDALHSQLPSQFIEQTIKTFLNLIGSHLSDILRCNDKIGIAVVAKFFELLSLVVQKHTSSLIIDVTAYALSQRDLILMPETSPEVRENFYQLLYHILMHHLTIFQNKVEFRTFFSSIIDAFCRSFELVDIEIVRENLKRLESLDEKRKLFHLNLFRQDMWLPTTRSLFAEMLWTRNNPLREHFINTLYYLAEVDFTSFYQQFVPMFLQSTPNLTNDQRHHLLNVLGNSVDQPTFALNLNNFAIDFCYFQMCRNRKNSK